MRRPFRSLAAAVAAATIAIAGCGIDPDTSPREIPAGEQPATSVERVNAAPQSLTGARVYLVSAAASGDLPRLTAVRRDVAATAQARLSTLFEGLNNGDREQRLRTAIPASARLLGADLRLDGRLAVVNVSEEFLSATDDDLADAVAQIVFTASELDGVAEVQIYVANERIELPRGDRSLTNGTLSVFDFPGFRPTSQPDLPSVPSPTA